MSAIIYHNPRCTKSNFWATWCPPCLKEIPAFVNFYEKNSDRVEILGVNYEQADIDKIIDFPLTVSLLWVLLLISITENLGI
jgi:thiol-disulfide isomerase/thioredoxin